MSARHTHGCTLRVTNIPRDMTLGCLREQMQEYGEIITWIANRNKLVAYATYKTPEEASRAMHGMREHNRLVLAFGQLGMHDPPP
jgi:hypothetical protein